jgi:hypothetical protein
LQMSSKLAKLLKPINNLLPANLIPFLNDNLKHNLQKLRQKLSQKQQKLLSRLNS